MSEWIKVEDDNVRHIWASKCDEDCESHGEEVDISPTFFEDNGEPSCCTCGNVFNYIRTEVKK